MTHRHWFDKNLKKSNNIGVDPKMEKLIEYKYILDNYRFRVPKEGTKDEYSTQFSDFDITFSFKNKLINEKAAKAIVSFLKKLKDLN